MAQSGSVLRSGRRGRRFKSSHLDSLLAFLIFNFHPGQTLSATRFGVVYRIKSTGTRPIWMRYNKENIDDALQEIGAIRLYQIYRHFKA